jgi:hypothetical protein
MLISVNLASVLASQGAAARLLLVLQGRLTSSTPINSIVFSDILQAIVE